MFDPRSYWQCKCLHAPTWMRRFLRKVWQLWTLKQLQNPKPSVNDFYPWTRGPYWRLSFARLIVWLWQTENTAVFRAPHAHAHTWFLSICSQFWSSCAWKSHTYRIHFSSSRERLRRVLRKKTTIIIHLHALTSADLYLHAFTSADLHLHTLTSAHVHLHTLTSVDLHLAHPHICWSTSSHLHICRSTFSHLHVCWSTSSHLHICWSTSSYLHICWSTSHTLTSADLHLHTLTSADLHLHTFTSADYGKRFKRLEVCR